MGDEAETITLPLSFRKVRYRNWPLPVSNSVVRYPKENYITKIIGDFMGEAETITTTIEIEKELFLKFKSQCVLKELKLSEVIQKMIEKWVKENSD